MPRIHLLIGAALGLLTLTATPTLAQAPAGASKVRSAREHKSPDEKAGLMTQRMTKLLTLTPEQQTTVGNLNTRLATDLSALRSEARAEKGAHRAKAQALRADYEANLKTTLTPEQYSRYEAQRAELQQKRRTHHQGRRGQGTKGATGQPLPAPTQK